MPDNDEPTDGIVESLPNRPLEFEELRALDAQEGEEYITMGLLVLKSDAWWGAASLSFTVLETYTIHVLGYSAEKRCWEVIDSFELEGEDWLMRQKRLVEEWAEDALADFDAEQEYVAPTEEPPV